MIKVGLLGCGTVGGGVVQLLRSNAAYIEARVGAPIDIVWVLVRDPQKERVPELDRSRVTTDANDVLADPSIDVVVEVMGGVDPAREYLTTAIAAGKQVVTANKMLLALHGAELLERARKHGVDLAFEGAVGGGIPVVRVLRDSLASDTIDSLAGIINGTSNYVLTRMRQGGLTFAAAVAEAQAKGYAEADPTLDVGGGDAAHKLVVLAMLAFGARLDGVRISTEGIDTVEPVDHAFAERFGFVVKQIAIARVKGDGPTAPLELRVHPALVAKDTPLANINGVLNAVAIEGRALGPCLLSGRGAGDLPTAVSVVADLVDVAIAKKTGVSGNMTRAIRLAERKLAPMSDVETRYYVRFSVFDRPGVLAKITGALGDRGVSIEQMVQQGRGGAEDVPVDVVMLTHEAKESAFQAALDTIGKSDYIARPPRMIRVH
jgi:homoserine dehydrogenase